MQRYVAQRDRNSRRHDERRGGGREGRVARTDRRRHRRVRLVDRHDPRQVHRHGQPGDRRSTASPSSRSLLIVWMRFRGTPFRLRVIRDSMWGGIALGADIALFFSAVKLTSIVNATIIGSMQPIVVGVIAARFFGERIGLRNVALVGSSPWPAPSSSWPQAADDGTTDLRGDLLALRGHVVVERLLHHLEELEEDDDLHRVHRGHGTLDHGDLRAARVRLRPGHVVAVGDQLGLAGADGGRRRGSSATR